MATLNKEIEELIGWAKGGLMATPNLLNLALVVAKKIEDREFEKLFTNELRGYKDTELPDYRMLQGRAVAADRFGRTQYVPTNDLSPEVAKALSTASIGDPIGGLEKMVREGTAGTITYTHSQANERIQVKALNLTTAPAVEVDLAQVEGIVEHVRGIILDWSIKLYRERIRDKELKGDAVPRDRTAPGEDLYLKVKALYGDGKVIDEVKARHIIEYADDAIKAFGETNQEKKVELKRIKREVEDALPSSTVEELRKRVEAKALGRLHPKNKVLRRVLYAAVALVMLVPIGLAVKEAISGKGAASSTETPALSPTPPAANPAASAIVPTTPSLTGKVPNTFSSRQIFFDRYSYHLGPLDDEKKLTLLRLFDFIENDRDVNDVRHVAYILATIKWESKDTWLPDTDLQGASESQFERNFSGKLGNTKLSDALRYKPRGYVKITGKTSYQRMADVLGLTGTDSDLVKNPDRALDPLIAYRITSYTMRSGWATNYKLSDFINNEKTDYINARKTVNGLDHAVPIATIAAKFEIVLRESLMQRK